MINSIPQRLICSKRYALFYSIDARRGCLRAAIIMMMLWPVFATAESARLPQTLAFTQQPIAFWSQLYHCVLTAAEFRKALKSRTLVNAVRFSPADADETSPAAVAVTPPVQPTATAPLPLPAIPILTQMLPPIADFTIPAPAAGNDGANSAVISVHSTAPDAEGNPAGIGRLPGESTPAVEAGHSVSHGPIASYPVSKAKLADIKARESKLGLPVSSQGISAVAVKNGVVDKQTGY
jgi:hypothetical protein